MHTLTGLLLSLSLLAPAASVAAPAASHPILGIWKVTLPDGSCSETYRFRGDGTSHVTSAAEVSESQFQIADAPSPNGFYKLDETVIKMNGQKDCSGAVMRVGTRSTHFIHFNPSGTLFIMCFDESFDVCLGPFRRVAGQDV